MWPLIQIGAAAGTEPLTVFAAVCRHWHLEQQRLASLFSKIELAAVVETHLVIALEKLLLAAIRTASSFREHRQLDIERLLEAPQAPHALELSLGVQPPLEHHLVAATLGVQRRFDSAGPNLFRQVERGGRGASLDPAVSLGQSRQVNDKCRHKSFPAALDRNRADSSTALLAASSRRSASDLQTSPGRNLAAQRCAAARPKKIVSSRSALGTLSEAWTEFICLLSP